MQIIKADFKKGETFLRITDPEDIWYLKDIIEKGDILRSKTTRKVKLGEGENSTSTKKTITLTIEAEDIEFSSDGKSLRINGKIKDGPEDIPIGSYHALSLEQDTDFYLEKKKWLEYQKEKLKESAEKKYKYIIIIFDREEALFALTKNYGYEILLKIKGEVKKKSIEIDIKKDFYEEIIGLLSQYNERYKPECIVLASPAFYKEDLLKKISDVELKKKIVLAISSDVSEAALDEVIKRPELSNTLKSSRNRKETLIIEELLSEINKNNLAVYGEKEVKEAIDAGAICKLLISNNFIIKKKSTNKFNDLDKIMKDSENIKAEIHIISSENEAGKRLDGLGGIAGILRYKLSWN